MEVWLKPNRRVLALGIFAGLLIMAGGILVFVLAAGQTSWLAVGSLFVIAGAVVAVLFARRLTRPRLAYRDGQLLADVGSAKPQAIPLEFVECIFLGESEAFLPGRKESTKVASIVVRLAERAAEFQDRAVSPSLGEWKDGYITVRGTWCERLSLDSLHQLNARLAELKRELAERNVAS